MLEGIEPANFRHREWRRILKRAGIGHRAMKDLRDTFASQLLTCGVNLAYVSRQLGHADIQITTQHYARWGGGDEYRDRCDCDRGRSRPICSRGLFQK